MLENISKFISGIVEGRDPDLNGHHQRLADKIVHFADHVGCSAEERHLLGIGASIHDVGKLSINEHILNKPTRLTASEMALVRQHPEIGYQLLSPLGLDPRITDVVRYHHENFDGTGYPGGLEGKSIPFLARIVRLWDTFDALTMNRPYHKGVPIEEALEVMAGSERHYDPELLRAFRQFILGRDSRSEIAREAGPANCSQAATCNETAGAQRACPC
ncbi:HD-GYP domain-containing protein [Halioxenophilus sp. WMMB6]|uniref:HD-GYP domain-containing protein n=1 Tax=Halioxenophilus sp. WMMB6 TaxID=3073815 RepID=UPI00295EA680|nr:HD domain-containing phosphohydrolase [Halioxenophilus sp. WMMB6]